MKKITDCGTAKLLGAIFGEDPDNIKRMLGIPLPAFPACPNCGKPLRKKRKYCNRECRHEFTRIKLVCACGCGKMFTRYQSEVVWKSSHPFQANGKPQERFFYSRACLSRWLGRNHGFGVHPENSGRPKGKSKYTPLIPEIIMRTRTGESLISVCRNLNIPEGSSYQLIPKLIKKYVESCCNSLEGYDSSKETGGIR